ncbi:hypothetical protein KUTeg_020515 [Tegillarca granosa]|uniref:Uncharacterized protein n=1 Tax=Tegillarca granosa TaxID=220873 RepID=A0ABQ9EE41_TEGGR|nr:hypothetical protein KUTeg_020515 [Tegillarca granosa]
MAEAANISIDNKDIGEKNDDKPTDGAVDVEEENFYQKLGAVDPYTRVCREKTIRKKCPEKLTILIIKFFFVTAQLCMFGADRAVFAKYLDRNNIAMKHLLLKGWQPEFETMPYPPTSGDYALYRIEELFEHIDYAITAKTSAFFKNVVLGEETSPSIQNVLSCEGKLEILNERDILNLSSSSFNFDVCAYDPDFNLLFSVLLLLTDRNRREKVNV